MTFKDRKYQVMQATCLTCDTVSSRNSLKTWNWGI